MKHLLIKLNILVAASFLISCGSKSNYDATLESITGKGIEKHIAVLASDDFKGRKPFTEGEDKTINYLKDEFEKAGLKPGNGNSYFQDVPMVAITSTPADSMIITQGKNKFSLAYMDEFSVSSPRMNEDIKMDASEIVFAGYGVVAPEYNWNDFEGLDVKGKTIVVLVNDPGNDANDSSFFKGNAMTYYGRWTYKFEEAARQGAAGVLVVHSEGPAGYPWAVARKNRADTRLYLQREDHNNSRAMMEGWITEDAARKLFKKKGVDYDQTVKSASVKGFKGFSLGMNLSLTIKNKIKESVSHNVIAVSPGTDHADEYIIYAAHWDHLGIGTPINGDSIYNGAIDNASGTACLLEMAKAFAQLSPKPSRSLVFLAVTAEEQGLLGSEYYATHPIFPLEKTVANINMDAMTLLGKMKDVTVVGYGQSELEDELAIVAKKQERYLMPDPKPGQGSYYRSDHFNFAKVGVPALDAKGRSDEAIHGKDWTQQQNDTWRKENYHRPSDEYISGKMNFDGMEQDARLLFMLGYNLSMQTNFPKWKEGSEFKKIREK
jgi:Zn-dependent M28 family amino/carboxypeptidase